LVLDKARKGLKASKVLFSEELYDAVLTESYDTMLRSARALIFSLGYKPRTVGSHTIVIKFCELFFEKDFQFLVARYRRMKGKRNYLIYGAGLSISAIEAKRAVQTAGEFLGVVEQKITKIKKQSKLL